MNLKSISIMAIATCSIVIDTFQVANAVEVDARVGKALESAGVAYKIIPSDKTYKTSIKLKGGRSQVVLIDSDTSKVNGSNMEFREVYSLTYAIDGELSQEMANRVMMQSSSKKIGAWQIIKQQGSSNKLLVFTAKIDAEMSGANLKRIIDSVGLSADKMENELTNGKDDY
jgi:DNA integrity scanning protein DisA with diadenylate cyclase activity